MLFKAKAFANSIAAVGPISHDFETVSGNWRWDLEVTNRKVQRRQPFVIYQRFSNLRYPFVLQSVFLKTQIND